MGGGASGVHAAWLLRRRGFNRTTLFEQNAGRLGGKIWTRAAPAAIRLQELQLSPGGSGALRVERRENWCWRLRHMYWAWDAAPGAAGPGSWRRDARLGVE